MTLHRIDCSNKWLYNIYHCVLSESYMLDNSMITILDYACVARFLHVIFISPLFITHLGRYWWPWVYLLRFWSRDSTGAGVLRTPCWSLVGRFYPHMWETFIVMFSMISLCC